jgi:hypothetical protein
MKKLLQIFFWAFFVCTIVNVANVSIHLPTLRFMKITSEVAKSYTKFCNMWSGNVDIVVVDKFGCDKKIVGVGSGPSNNFGAISTRSATAGLFWAKKSFEFSGTEEFHRIVSGEWRGYTPNFIGSGSCLCRSVVFNDQWDVPYRSATIDAGIIKRARGDIHIRSQLPALSVFCNASLFCCGRSGVNGSLNSGLGLLEAVLGRSFRICELSPRYIGLSLHYSGLSIVDTILQSTNDNQRESQNDFNPVRRLEVPKPLAGWPLALGWFFACVLAWFFAAKVGHEKRSPFLIITALFLMIAAFGGAGFILLYEDGYLSSYDPSSENACASHDSYCVASHASNTATISDISQSLGVTPAAIAGVIFRV